VIQQLGFAAGFAPADTEAARLAKLEALLRQGTEDVGGAAPLVAALLGIEADARHPARELTPAQQRTRTLAVLVEQLVGLARRRPVLMVLEDAHWADPTTLELVGQALDWIAGVPALLLLTSRPDNQPPLGGHPHVTRLTLNRLGRGPTEAIVARLIGDRGLPPEVLAEITVRTDGVPLFVEELTKAVLEAGTAGVGAVPASLHASLMARLDRVPGVKEVAQVAACLGREFAYPLLAAVSPTPEPELRTALDRLAAAELVFRRGTPPEASYAFKHALVRDAAYESLLKTQRQQLHARIARALEERFPGTAEAEPELLARHCAEAGLAEQAVDYRRRAGEQALARSAMAEAAAQLTKGLELLEALPDGQGRRRRELRLQLALGQASIAAKGFAAPETGRAYARAHELCRELGDVPELFPALYGRSVFHFQRGELAAAHEVAQELRRSAEERGEAAAWVTGHRMMGSASCQLGRLAESREHFEAALAHYEPERDRSSAYVYAIDSRVMCLSWLSHVLAILGYPDQALARDGEVPAHARELAHHNTAAVALAWSCIFHQLLRNRTRAREQAEAVIGLATEQGFPLYLAAGTVVRGWALAGSGRAAEGIAEIRRGLAAYAATGAEMWSPYFLGLLAEASGWAGEAAAGLDAAGDALQRVERTGAR
jgi:predicted ATPase